MEPVQRKPHRPTPPGAWWAAVAVDAALLITALYGLASSQTWAGRAFAAVVLIIDWAIFGWLMANRPSRRTRTA